MSAIDRHRKRTSVGNVYRNTFIGGISGRADLKNWVAGRFDGIVASDLQEFIVIGDDVRCFIDKDYIMSNAGFDNVSELTHFIDLDGHCTNTQDECFKLCPILRSLYIPGMLRVDTQDYTFSELYNFEAEAIHTFIGTTQLFREVNARYIRLPNVVGNFSGSTSYDGFFSSWMKNSNALRCYMPQMQVTPLTSLTILYANTKSGVTWYVHPNQATNAPAAIAAAEGTGSIFRYVTDLTPPSDITDLRVIPLNNTSAVFFLPILPTSLNGLDFYEVWIETYGEDNFEEKLFIYGELGDFLETFILPENFIGKIKIRACDIFWNRSGFSNIIDYDYRNLQEALSYPLLTDSNEATGNVNGIDGVDTDMSYDGTEATFNGTTSFISIPDSPILNFTDGINDKPFSIEFEVEMDSINEPVGILFLNKKLNNSDNIAYHFVYLNSTLQFTLFGGNTNQDSITKLYSITLQINTPYKIKGTYNGSKNVSGVRLFLNDVEVGSDVIFGTYAGMAIGNAPVILSRRGNNLTSGFLDGIMKNLKFYLYEKLT